MPAFKERDRKDDGYRFWQLPCISWLEMSKFSAAATAISPIWSRPHVYRWARCLFCKNNYTVVWRFIQSAGTHGCPVWDVMLSMLERDDYRWFRFAIEFILCKNVLLAYLFGLFWPFKHDRFLWHGLTSILAIGRLRDTVIRIGTFGRIIRIKPWTWDEPILPSYRRDLAYLLSR